MVELDPIVSNLTITNLNYKVMEAKEAPEKIYLTPLEYMAASCQPQKDNTVEYTRTDAFIERACSWLENNLQGIVGGSIYIEDFENYMKGE